MKKVTIFVVIMLMVFTSFSIKHTSTASSKMMFETGLSEHTINHGGRERSFKLLLPSSYDGTKKHALVFVLHGGGGNARIAHDKYNFPELAEKEGFICVFPDGTGNLKNRFLTWNSGNCCSYAYENDIDDVGFFDFMIDFLSEKLLIDENRVYSCGMSNGAMMSFRLALELSDKIAAVGIVAGAQNIESRPVHPVSVIQIHGTDDRHVLYEGGIGDEQVGDKERTDNPVSYAKDFWTNRNGCSNDPESETINEVKIDTYYGGRLGTEYKLYTVDDFGHSWPGAKVGTRGAPGETDCSISATEEIWKFFKAHPKKSNPLEDVNTWGYQLQDLWDEKLDALENSKYDMLVIDRNGSIEGEDDDYDDSADIEKIRGEHGNRLVICYIDVGEAESYRKYWQDDWEVGNPEWILTPDPDGWDENYLVKFWEDEWVNIMLDEFDKLIDAGYDGAYLDWLEIYDDPHVRAAAKKGGLNTEEELTKFVRKLASHARTKNPDFLFIAQNASAMGKHEEYRNLFDGIAQEAIWFDGTGDPDDSDVEADTNIDSELSLEYLKNLRIWQAFGLPVFNCEYAESKSDTAFELGIRFGHKTYCARRPLEELSRTPPNFDEFYKISNIVHDDELRPIYVFSPNKTEQDVPLVIVLHGGGGNAITKLRSTNFIDLAKAEGFAVVFANGQLKGETGKTDARTWAAGNKLKHPYELDTDIRYISRVIDETAAELDIDKSRVFVCGHSMGGMMSHRLACELSDKITAIASIAGPLMHEDCHPSKKMPILHIHGTKDPVVPFTGGPRRSSGMYPDVMEMITSVAQRNGHDDKPKISEISENVSKYEWGTENKVELIKLEGFEHTWPNEENFGFCATEYIWCFFSDY